MLRCLNIGSDIDGTMIVATGDAKFLVYLEKLGYENASVVFQDTHSWQKATGLEEKEISEIYAEFIGSDGYVPPAPIPGAPEALLQLSGEYNIHLITARGKGAKEPTLKHLGLHYDFTFAASHWSALGTKHQVVKKIRALVYFEDNALQAKEVAQVTKVVLIPSPGHYQACISSKVTVTQAQSRVGPDMSEDDWQDVWRQAWEEIPHLVADFRKNQSRKLICSSSKFPSIRARKRA